MQLIANTTLAPDLVQPASTFSGLDGELALLEYSLNYTGNLAFSVFLKSTTPQSVRLRAVSQLPQTTFLNITTRNIWTRYTMSANVLGAAKFGIASNAFAEAFSVFIWGAQLEDGLVSTSYIPTKVAIATRSADIFTGHALYSNADKGSDSVLLTTAVGQSFTVGDMFSISGLLLQAAETVTATSATTEVKLVNRLRKALVAGASVNFDNPKIKWRLDSASEVGYLVGYTSPVTLSFIEDI